MLQELQIKNTDKILEIGSGSGYFTALLASKGGYVHSVEIVPDLKAMARKTSRGMASVMSCLRLATLQRGGLSMALMMQSF